MNKGLYIIFLSTLSLLVAEYMSCSPCSRHRNCEFSWGGYLRGPGGIPMKGDDCHVKSPEVLHCKGLSWRDALWIWSFNKRLNNTLDCIDVTLLLTDRWIRFALFINWLFVVKIQISHFCWWSLTGSGLTVSHWKYYRVVKRGLLVNIPFSSLFFPWYRTSILAWGFPSQLYLITTLDIVL